MGDAIHYIIHTLGAAFSAYLISRIKKRKVPLFSITVKLNFNNMKNFLLQYGTLITGLAGTVITLLIGLQVIPTAAGVTIMAAVTSVGHLLGSISDVSTPVSTVKPNNP